MGFDLAAFRRCAAEPTRNNEGWYCCGCGEDMTEAADEIARLTAIVDKLPTTADGVSVVPGMNVYFQWHSGEIVRHPVAFIRIDKDDTWLYFERALYRSTGVCYSTREAADAAGKDGE
jgi:hypothetical protein